MGQPRAYLISSAPDTRAHRPVTCLSIWRQLAKLSKIINNLRGLNLSRRPKLLPIFFFALLKYVSMVSPETAYRIVLF